MQTAVLSTPHPARAAALFWLTQPAHGMHTCPHGHQIRQRWRHPLCPPDLSGRCVHPPWNASSPAGQPEAMTVLCSAGVLRSKHGFGCQCSRFRLQLVPWPAMCAQPDWVHVCPWLSQPAMKRQLACTMLASWYTPDFGNQMATSRRHGTQASS